MNRKFYRTPLAGTALAVLATAASLHAQTWSQKTRLPGSARDAAIAFTIDDKIYVGGGVSAKDFYQYDPRSGAWTRKADIPGVAVERAFGAGFSIDGKGYVGFGYDGNDNLLHDFWQYDPAENAWTRKADFPGAARDGVTAFAVGSKGYAGGGSDNKILFGDFYSYDPASDTWTKKEDLPTGPIIFQGSFTIGASAYVATGSIGALEVPEVYRYDAANDSWDQMADFPGTPRQAAVAFAANGRGYVGMGQTGYTSVLSDFYSYDPVSNTWSPAPGMGSGQGRAWSVGASAAGRAYIGTGWNLGSTFYSDWWELNAAAGMEGNAPSKEIGIHPNPTRGLVTLTMPSTAARGAMSIVDRSGREVMRGAIPSDGVLDISSLPAGCYLLRVQSGMATRVEKIIKE